MTQGRDPDLEDTADRIVALVRSGEADAGLRLLETQRAGQPQPLRDALDRYVAGDVNAQLQAQSGVLRIEGHGAALVRLASASEPPAMPAVETLDDLSHAQRHHVYASIAHVRGGPAAQASLERADERLILGLRQETDTRASATRNAPDQVAPDDRRTPINESARGTGVYDDRIVVLWTDTHGGRHVHEARYANTEPTAQYDHHAGSDGRRAYKSGGVAPQRTDSAGYEDVKERRIEGADRNNDGARDLGRLADGAIEMQRATHPSGRNQPDHDAFRPTQGAVGARPQGVQRDTNADGRFTAADINGVEALNNTFKIHRGSTGSTDSAGCQTIHPDQYDNFINAAMGNRQQTRWQYVLTATDPVIVRDRQAGVDRDKDIQQPTGTPRVGEAAPGPDSVCLARQAIIPCIAMQWLQCERLIDR